MLPSRSRRAGIIAAGILCWASARARPSLGQVGFGPGESLDARAALAQARAAAASAAPPSQPTPAVEWVLIKGGRFLMGAEGAGAADAQQVHEVTVPDFQMSRTAVTVAQFAECVDRGWCAKPGLGERCNWAKKGRERHPINCVDWYEARAFAQF